MLTKLSLFSGIGGDDLASEWAGIETVCFVEIDKYCQKVLRKHWLDIPIIEKVQDVTKEKVMAYAYQRRKQQQERCEQNIGGWTLDRSKEKTLAITNCGTRLSSNQAKPIGGKNAWPEIGRRSSQGYTIDIISGGFPCQPHSVAGKRKGSLDERNLWPEFRRIIGEIKPRWVVAENVPGLFSSDAGRFFGEVLADLAALGYSTGWCTYGAVDVGALHRRNRVFIVAHAIDNEYKRAKRRSDRETETVSTEYRSADGTTRRTSRTSKIRSTSDRLVPWIDVAYSPQRENNGRGRGDLDNQATGWQGIDPAVIAGSKNVPDTAIPGLEGAEPERAVSTTGLPTQCREIPDSQSEPCNGSNGKGSKQGYRESGGCSSSDGGTGSIKSRLGGMVDGLSPWLVEPDIPRVITGCKDRVNKLKGLGNACVPQQIYPIYQAIVELENERNRS
jgi:DNA (cytosine-5)-methyltransferase 1